MKIALFLNSYPKLSEPFIDLFISHLEEEHQVYLITQIDKKTKKKTSITILPFLNFKGLGIIEKFKISCKFFFYLKRYFVLRAKGILSKQLISDAGLWTIPKLDYIHFPFGNLAFGREHYAEVMGCKMSISFRGSDLNVYPVFHNLNYGLVLEKSDKIHCNSIELKNKLSNHGLLKLEKVTIIHSAIRSDYELNDSVLQSAISQRNYNTEKIITVGRLHWVKDYALSFQALGILKKEGFQFEYNIIGDGPDKEHLMYLADLFSISENINFLGSKNAVEIKKELQNSTLYLQTSLAEGFSNSCLEAQSQGLMCVVTDVSGMSACIENEKTGFIVNERKPELVSVAIKKIHQIDINSRKEREIYTSNRVFNSFSHENQKQSWLKFFEA